jgi:hypothetical protein
MESVAPPDGLAKVALQDGDTERFIAQVDPDVAPAVKDAEGEGGCDGVGGEGALACEDAFFETFASEFYVVGDQA